MADQEVMVRVNARSILELKWTLEEIRRERLRIMILVNRLEILTQLRPKQKVKN